MDLETLGTELRKIINQYCVENCTSVLDFIQQMKFFMKDAGKWSIEDKKLIYEELERALEKVEPEPEEKALKAFDIKKSNVEYVSKWIKQKNDVPLIDNCFKLLTNSFDYKTFIEKSNSEQLSYIKSVLSATEHFCIELKALIEVRNKVIYNEWLNDSVGLR